jgi:hypothetical protein
MPFDNIYKQLDIMAAAQIAQAEYQGNCATRTRINENGFNTRQRPPLRNPSQVVVPPGKEDI